MRAEENSFKNLSQSSKIYLHILNSVSVCGRKMKTEWNGFDQ